MKKLFLVCAIALSVNCFASEKTLCKQYITCVNKVCDKLPDNFKYDQKTPPEDGVYYFYQGEDGSGRLECFYRKDLYPAVNPLVSSVYYRADIYAVGNKWSNSETRWCTSSESKDCPVWKQ